MLAAYLSGCDIEEAIFEAKQDVHRNRQSIRYWKENPSPESDEQIKEDKCKLRVSRRRAFLFNKYMNSRKVGKPLSIKEDKELFFLFMSQYSYRSLDSINYARDEVRVTLTYLSDIKSYVQGDHEYIHEQIKKEKYFNRSKTNNFLKYNEQVCIKYLERPNELTNEEQRWVVEIGRAIQLVVWQLKPETHKYYLKYWDTFNAIRASYEEKTGHRWKTREETELEHEDDLRRVIEKTCKLDVRTDKFTELAEVFYGYIDIGDDIEYLQIMKPTDSPTHTQDKARLIYLLNKFKELDSSLSDDDNRELFNLYTTHINKRSPQAINEERDRIRAIFILQRKMWHCDRYKIEWLMPNEADIAEDCFFDLGIICEHLLFDSKKVTFHEYRSFKVLFNIVAHLAQTIPQYNNLWEEYLQTEGVHKNYDLQIDTIEDIIARSLENDLNKDSFTMLTRYLYGYEPLIDMINNIKYQIKLDIEYIKYVKQYQEMQSNNTDYINIMYSMIREKRRFLSLLYLYTKSKDKGKPISDNIDKQLYRLYMSYRNNYIEKTINEDRDTYRAQLRLASDIRDAIAKDQLTWKSKYEKDRLTHYLNHLTMRCIASLDYPNEADTLDYSNDCKRIEFIINITRTTEPLKKYWKKYMNALKNIHDRYHSKEDKRITVSSEHDVKTDRFTELAEYFYGFDNQQDSLKYFRYILADNEKEIEYYREHPDKQKLEYGIFDIEMSIKYRKMLIELLSKYLKGKRLTIEEDRKLFQFYVEHRAIASPMEINKERERNRNLLSSISKMKDNPRYAAFDLSKLERLCIKLLESPKEVTSSDYTEFAQLRDSVLSHK